MNGRACLLREIQDLFAGTGLGGAHYAIIEQGRIGQILSSKPLDRRALIEEAAGITKFKSRKRATELKLESAKQNLTRLNDIITEVERQVNSLKRQAQKARRYRRLREEMRSLLKIIFAADFYRTQADYFGFIRQATGGSITLGYNVLEDVMVNLAYTLEFINVEPGTMSPALSPDRSFSARK